MEVGLGWGRGEVESGGGTGWLYNGKELRLLDVAEQTATMLEYVYGRDFGD
jgi:hypothetical protein